MGRKSRYIVPVDRSPAAIAAAGYGLENKHGLENKGLGFWSWILINSSGEEMMLNLDKYAIMQRVQIHARDIRILDPLLSYPSTILGRERAIVLNLEHIKAIITAEEILLRNTFDDNIIPVVEELRRHFIPINTDPEDHSTGKALVGQDDVEMAEEDESAFEFRALEVALEAICSYLAAKTMELETAIYPALDMLTSKISSRNLDQVRKLKSQMTRLTGRALKVRDALEQLLDDDGDMAELYLSRKLAGSSSPRSGSGVAFSFLVSPTIGSKISKASRESAAAALGDDENNVEELEMLLEAYFTQIDDTLKKLNTLREYIDNTEDYINIQLDTRRNQLIKLELILTAGVVSLAIYSLWCGLLGTNLPYSWNQDHGYMFKWVVLAETAFCGLIFVSIISYARYKGLLGS